MLLDGKVAVVRSRTELMLCAVFVSLPILTASETVSCESALATVSAPNRMLADSVCATFEETQSLLGQCELEVSKSINIEVFDALPSVSNACFGFYEYDTNRISLRSPDSIATVIEQSTLYEGLDPKTVFDSIVVHEVSHAAFAQTAFDDAACLANHEYVAYVMQMWSLPPSIRSEIVDRFGQVEPVAPQRLSEIVAVMAPAQFAALAWQHFNEDGHGCDFVQDLVIGRASLEIVWY